MHEVELAEYPPVTPDGSSPGLVIGETQGTRPYARLRLDVELAAAGERMEQQELFER